MSKIHDFKPVRYENLVHILLKKEKVKEFNTLYTQLVEVMIQKYRMKQSVP